MSHESSSIVAHGSSSLSPSYCIPNSFLPPVEESLTEEDGEIFSWCGHLNKRKYPIILTKWLKSEMFLY